MTIIVVIIIINGCNKSLTQKKHSNFHPLGKGHAQRQELEKSSTFQKEKRESGETGGEKKGGGNKMKRRKGGKQSCNGLYVKTKKASAHNTRASLQKYRPGAARQGWPSQVPGRQLVFLEPQMDSEPGEQPDRM